MTRPETGPLYPAVISTIGHPDAPDEYQVTLDGRAERFTSYDAAHRAALWALTNRAEWRNLATSL